MCQNRLSVRLFTFKTLFFRSNAITIFVFIMKLPPSNLICGVFLSAISLLKKEKMNNTCIFIDISAGLITRPFPSVGLSVAGVDRAKLGFYLFRSILFIVAIVISI